MLVKVKKKVIFFLQAGCGGAERMTITISKYLDKSKYNVVYYTVGGKGETIKPFFPKNSLVKKILCKNYRDFVTIKILKVLHKEKPDIIFASAMPLNYRLLAASILFLKKIKIIIRNDNYIETQSFIQKMRLAIFYQLADVIIAQTKEMREGLIKTLRLSSSKVITLTNPVDTEFINDKINIPNPFSYSDHKINFVASGRFSPQKGFDILVRAFSIVIKELPNSELYIIGSNDGDFSQHFLEIQNLTKSLNLQKNIHFLGFLENPYAYVKNADCFVLSSRNEGLPNVLLEALYLGVPSAVCKCIPVIERIVQEGENGYLADNENYKQLAVAMVKAKELRNVENNFTSSLPVEYNNLFI